LSDFIRPTIGAFACVAAVAEQMKGGDGGDNRHAAGLAGPSRPGASRQGVR